MPYKQIGIQKGFFAPMLSVAPLDDSRPNSLRALSHTSRQVALRHGETDPASSHAPCLKRATYRAACSASVECPQAPARMTDACGPGLLQAGWRAAAEDPGLPCSCATLRRRTQSCVEYESTAAERGGPAVRAAVRIAVRQGFRPAWHGRCTKRFTAKALPPDVTHGEAAVGADRRQIKTSQARPGKPVRFARVRRGH